MTDPLYLILSRKHGYDEGLRARVADPVWFLTRQWQLGEFRARMPQRRSCHLAPRHTDNLRPNATGSHHGRTEGAAGGRARRLVDD
jgi:hypothetical protein